MGALPTLRAATDPDAIGGTYYGPDGFMQLTGYPVVVASSSRSQNAGGSAAPVGRVGATDAGSRYPV